MAETIIALATPPGVSALAILRLSGSEVTHLTGQLLRQPVCWEPQRVIYRKLFYAEELLDDVVLTYWRSPRSYTGEDLVEISCHGNPLIVQRILQAFFTLGARTAEPGEFTQRAFLNGKINLTQAEAVADVVAAATHQALRGAQAMHSDALGQALQNLRTELIDLLANLEAYIDFPDEDISPETGEFFQQRIRAVLGKIELWLSSAPAGRILREGVMTVIVGSPNVGKSSLFNALLRSDRAIVSPVAGTTRDVIENECNVGGFRLRLLDTAGQRATQDKIEAEGVRRAEQAVEQAELILHLIDATHGEAEDLYRVPALRPDQHLIAVAHKSDLGLHPDHEGKLAVSSRSGFGLVDLEKRIVEILSSGADLAAQGWLTVNARQESALHRAHAALTQALHGLENRQPAELVSIDLRSGLQAVGEVVGLAVNEDILDALFKKFCIGK